MSKIAAVSIAIVLVFLCGAARAQEKQPRKLQLAYGAASSSRIPYWVAKEAKLYEKYGLDANLVFISGAPVALNALLAGDVQMVATSGVAGISLAAQGGPIAIIANIGPTPYKLVAHPSTNSIPRIERKSHRHGPRGRCHRLCVAGPVAAVRSDPRKGRTASEHGLE